MSIEKRRDERYVTTRIIHATTTAERSRFMRLFMCMPHLLMPSNASNTRIIEHLHHGRAFNIRPRDGMAQRPRVNHDYRDRKAKRIEMLMNDCRVSGAVKMMQADAAAPRPSEEDGVQESEEEKWKEIIESLKKKFPERETENDFKPEPIRHVSPFSTHQVFEVVRSMPRHAATAIDGWTRDLIMCAIANDQSVAEDLGVILAQVAMSHAPESHRSSVFFDELTMDIIRAARLVGIPKPEGGVRPIVISSVIAKLTGALILRRANVRRLRNQYAIKCRNGCPLVVHRTRKAYEEGVQA
jgi:hypothetical protein